MAKGDKKDSDEKAHSAVIKSRVCVFAPQDIQRINASFCASLRHLRIYHFPNPDLAWRAHCPYSFFKKWGIAAVGCHYAEEIYRRHQQCSTIFSQLCPKNIH
ncbi:hypothetical protein TcG_11170 [Trypanosoma cruzi]|nr:hypothetical protein TcG_11170 [Trypanosoma cruzi]